MKGNKTLSLSMQQPYVFVSFISLFILFFLRTSTSGLVDVCELAAVGKMPDCQQRGPGFSPRPVEV